MNFDDKARDWDKDPKKAERAAIFAAGIIAVLGRRLPGKALELGSGTGLVSFQLKDHFSSVILADTSGGMMEVLREKIRKEEIKGFNPLKISDVNDLNALSGIDVVYTLLTLHHIESLDDTFRVFGKVLVPGGFLFIGDLMTEDGSFHHKDPEFDGHKGFDTKELINSIQKHGFEAVEEKIFYTIEKEHNGVMKKYPLFFLALKKK